VVPPVFHHSVDILVETTGKMTQVFSGSNYSKYLIPKFSGYH
jgi:hypothetical protein